MADHFDDLLTWYRTRYRDQMTAGSNIPAARMDQNYSVLSDAVFSFRNHLEIEEKGANWRVAPVCYGRCLHCGSNWSTGTYHVDACPLCMALYVALREAQQANRQIWVRAAAPVKGPSVHRVDAPVLGPGLDVPKSARDRLSNRELFRRMTPLQIVVSAVEAAFALFGLWKLLIH